MTNLQNSECSTIWTHQRLEWNKPHQRWEWNRILIIKINQSKIFILLTPTVTAALPFSSMTVQCFHLLPFSELHLSQPMTARHGCGSAIPGGKWVAGFPFSSHRSWSSTVQLKKILMIVCPPNHKLSRWQAIFHLIPFFNKIAALQHPL